MNSINILLVIGMLLSALPMLLFLTYIMVFKNLARTSEHLLIVSVPSFLGFVLVFFAYFQAVTFTSISALMYAMSAFLITFLYIYWYSNNKRKLARLLNDGLKLPVFSVQDTQGSEIQSSSFYTENKALIIFYRGNWCPLCMAQIDEIVALYKKFEQNNIQVIFIAPQSAKNTQKLADKFHLNFKFYTDKDNQAAKKIGIAHTFGLPMGFQTLGYDSDSVYPTVIAVDESGTIIYNDQTSNYRVRPGPEELLAIFLL